MDQDDLDTLSAMPAATKRDAEAILIALEGKPDNFNTTTWQLAEEVLGYKGSDTWYLFDLHIAICALAEAHGLKIDGDHHNDMDMGLPFCLDYYVRRKASTSK